MSKPVKPKIHKQCPFKGGQSVKNECPFANELIAIMDRINPEYIHLKDAPAQSAGQKSNKIVKYCINLK
jgi:hypothetical protein